MKGRKAIALKLLDITAVGRNGGGQWHNAGAGGLSGSNNHKASASGNIAKMIIYEPFC
jgi:hypothetical protein